jgi:multidrug efflux pump subunit AcrB
MTIPEQIDTKAGVIAWFARNPVAANLMMLVIMFVGIGSAMSIQRTLQPDLELNIIQITVPYPGATPEEVENGIILKIEEALKDIDSIDTVESTADESLASVKVEVFSEYDINVVLDEIKSAVDAITSFPAEVERPIIKRVEFRNHVMNLQVSGNIDEASRKALAEQIKLEMLQNSDISYVNIRGAREYEISIEIPEYRLLKYGLTLSEVADAIRRSSLDIPGGSIKTETGDILLKTRGQARRQHEFEKVVLISYPDGTRLTLADVAEIRDGFEEKEGFALFDKKPSINLEIFAVGSQDYITVAEAVYDYVEKKQQTLPNGVELDTWADVTYYLKGRMDMMLSNLGMGALLVFVILAMFLNIKLAFWVMLGLPVCFLGTFAILPAADVSLNMISLFGFILVLGIVVDDAIIIGESTYSEAQRYGHSEESVIRGALRVATPATFGVLTTIVAFAPTMFASGIFAVFPAACGWVVTGCLTFSLIESKWILPAHLVHSKPGEGKIWQRLDKIPQYFNHHMDRFVASYYRPFLIRAIAQRYVTSAVFIGLLVVTLGLIAGGVIRYVLIPEMPGDFLQANVEMVEGTPAEQTRRAYQQMADALDEVAENLERSGVTGKQKLIKHTLAIAHNDLNTSIMVELSKSEDRAIEGKEIARLWREQIGAIPGAKILSVDVSNDGGGPAVSLKLSASNNEQLEGAARELQTMLRQYKGVFDIRNGANTHRDEIVLEIKPSAELLGLSSSLLGRQVRDAFYGAEAQRIQRGNDEVKVMVRFPRDEREATSDLQNMYIRSPNNDFIPLDSVARLNIEPNYSKLTRIDGERSITVTAEVDKAVAEPQKVLNDILAATKTRFDEQYPTVKIQLSGESEETGIMLFSLAVGFALALFGIYGLLAIPLKSYLQPIIIMGVIPFGIIGAVVGHIVLGMAFSMMSFFGVIALSGVVVNDSLIMVDFINSAIARGERLRDAVIDSGCVRFRAILLTSLTTFVGLLPMLLETSAQAQFVIPMAISLGFGIIFATVITLLLIPSLYVILDDLKNFKEGRHKPLPAAEQA